MRHLPLVIAAACGPGNVATDYAPPALRALGIHAAPTYVARDLLPTTGRSTLLAHPRLGQPAIRRAGEAFDVGWIGRADEPFEVAGAPVALADTACDAGICHATAIAPALAPGLYDACIAGDCSPSALAIVAAYADPLEIAHVSDAHIGDGDSAAVFARVIDDIIAHPPDVVIFTGDASDDGTPEQRGVFLAELARLPMPVFAITGNHDYEHAGLDGYLLDVGPELDYAAPYGPLKLIGLSSGQDMDDGEHDDTISESDGPDPSQLAWLNTQLDQPSIVFLHHPIYNGLFATVGPQSRDELRSLVTCDTVRAVLSGHTHITNVYDADGNSRDLSTDGEDDVPRARWPLHYIAARATVDPGYAVLHIGTDHVDYRWRALP